MVSCWHLMKSVKYVGMDSVFEVASSRPVAGAPHPGNDCGCVKVMGECMDKSCNRTQRRNTVDSVAVCWRIKLQAMIPRMLIQASQP
jgi:hypothetical protein